MSISALSATAASIAAALPPDGTDQSTQLAVLKKANDLASQSAVALINALPQPQRLPENLGRNVNTTA
jgi:hypothetical protein